MQLLRLFVNYPLHYPQKQISSFIKLKTMENITKEFLDSQIKRLGTLLKVSIDILNLNFGGGYESLQINDSTIYSIKKFWFSKKYIIKEISSNIRFFFKKELSIDLFEIKLKNIELSRYHESSRYEKDFTIRGVALTDYVMITECPSDFGVIRENNIYSKKFFKEILSSKKSYSYETTHGGGTSTWSYTDPLQIENL